MPSAADLTLEAFTSALASKSSTPGGGGAAALTGSQAAALNSMVIHFTVGRKKYAAVEDEMRSLLERCETLRTTLLDYIDRDADAFKAVSACYSMPRETGEEKEARSRAIQEALKGATLVPFEIGTLCLEVITLATPIAEKGNSNVVSDAATAAHLAFGALLSALVNVSINLKFIQDEEFCSQWQPRAEKLTADAQLAYNEARKACSQTLGVTV